MTNNLKNIDPVALAGLTSGLVLVENGFSAMHAAAEHVLGHPVWTHHFASKDLWHRMRDLILAQFPEMPTTDGEESWTPEKCKVLAEELRARYGETVPVAGGGEPPISPFRPGRMSEKEFCERFVAHMVKHAGFASFDDGGSVADYAAETAPSYWAENQGRDSPEECADADISYWGE